MSLANLGTHSVSKVSDNLSDQDTPEQTQDSGDANSYSAKMAEFDRQEKEDLMNTGLSTEQYLEKLYKRERAELDYLKELSDPEHPERMNALSADDKADMQIRMKNLEYNEETRDISRRYRESLDDKSMSAEEKEKIANAYNQRQADLKQFRELMSYSGELGENEHMIRMRDLEKELEAADGVEAQNEKKMQIAGTQRAFEQQLAQDPQLQEDFLKFVENNRENKVIRESGLGESVERFREKQGRAAEAEISSGKVRPAGKAHGGAIESDDPEAEKTAEAEAMAGADDGMGGKDPLRLQGGQDMDRGAAAAAQATPGSTQDRESGAALGG
ncbi:MAG: hypothetical protein AB7L92_00105 [Alphaproteobacteria bacterium]